MVGITSTLSGNYYKAINTGPYFTLYYKNNEISLGRLFSALGKNEYPDGVGAWLFSYQYFLNSSRPIKLGLSYNISYSGYFIRNDYFFPYPSLPNNSVIYSVVETYVFIENYIGGVFREELFKHIYCEQYVGMGLSNFTYTKKGNPFGENENINSSYFSGMLRIGIGYKF